MSSKRLISQKVLLQFKNKYEFVPFEYPDLLVSEPPSKLVIKSENNGDQDGLLLFAAIIKSQNFKSSRHQTFTFLSLCKMFFPQITGEGIHPIDINVMDTIFYTSESVPLYIFNDSKKGLVRLKHKNSCELFLKRRYQSELSKTSKENNIQSPSQGSPELSIRQSQQAKLKYYQALLRYKDQSCIRLKEPDLKAIFLNPLQANEKFRHLGNIQYIQALPIQKPQDDPKDLYTIEFKLQKFKNQELFKLAVELVCQQSCFTGKIDTKPSRIIKEQIQHFSEETLLYFVTFQIYAYLSIHYAKRLQQGSFHFVRNDKNVLCLANASKFKIRSFTQGKQQFSRATLMNQNHTKCTDKDISGCMITSLQNEGDQCAQKENIFGEKNQQLSLLEETILQYFDRQNQSIRKHLRNFVSGKFDCVKNPKDQQLSSSVFKTLNPDIKEDFHEILKDDTKFLDFIQKKTSPKFKKFVRKDSLTLKSRQGQKQQNERWNKKSLRKESILSQTGWRQRNKERDIFALSRFYNSRKKKKESGKKSPSMQFFDCSIKRS